MSLATKYRPKDFDEVVGQDIVVNTIKKELKNNNIKQSYLFVGKSGCGKSSLSRIVALKTNGETTEVDAASNNSAEAIKTLLDSVKTRPLLYEYHVVRLDEIQCLSVQAIQKLLLTLEQPPKHLIFILCTTEVDKIPQTIYNRCEVFEFVSIPVDKIKQRLMYICDKENFVYNEEALKMIARLADGSMRQAISYLEQCSSSDITIDTVKQILLADSYDNYLNLVYAILDKEKDKVVRLVKGANNIDKYIMGLFSFILDISIYSSTNDINLISVPEIYAEDFSKLDKKDIKEINKLRNILLDLQFEGKGSPILKQMLIATLYKFIEGEQYD